MDDNRVGHVLDSLEVNQTHETEKTDTKGLHNTT